jgi:hypothetical protein
MMQAGETAMPIETSAGPLGTAHHLASALWQWLTERPRSLTRSHEALLTIDDADLSDTGRRLRREALYDLRDRQRQRRSRL